MPRYYLEPSEAERATIERAKSLRVRLFAERIEQKVIANLLSVPAPYLSLILNGRVVYSTTNDLLDKAEAEIEKILEEREQEAKAA